MINNKKVLAIIPVLNNFLSLENLNDLTLLEWTIIEAAKSEFIDYVIIASNEVLNDIVEPYMNELKDKIIYVPIPEDSEVSDLIIAQSINEKIKSDYIIFLDINYPIRNDKLLDLAIEDMFSKNCETLVSVKKENPIYWNFSNNEANSIYDTENKFNNYPPEECLYKECGNFLITTKEVLEGDSKFGTNVSLYEINLLQSFSAKTEEELNILNLIIKDKNLI